jgi:hypothetical protein
MTDHGAKAVSDLPPARVRALRAVVKAHSTD